MIPFTVLGHTIEIHNDLKKYYNIVQISIEKKNALIMAINQMHNRNDLPDVIISTLEQKVKKDIDSYICELSKYGLIDVTYMDFLGQNKGWNQIINASRSYYKNRNNARQKYENEASYKKQIAYNKAENSVSIPGTIYTSSFAEAIALSMSNQFYLKKQADKADRYYAEACRNIELMVNANVEESTHQYYHSNYIPQLIASISPLYSEIVMRYLQMLSKCGQFDLSCMDSIDLNKAHELIESNFSVIADKVAVLIRAVMLAPFSVDVYKSIYYNYCIPNGIALNTCCSEIIAYFNLTPFLENMLVPLDSLCSNAKELLTAGEYSKAASAYSEITTLSKYDYRGWLGLFIAKTEKFSRTEFNKEELDGIICKLQQIEQANRWNDVMSEECRGYISSVYNLRDTEQSLLNVYRDINANKENGKYRFKLNSGTAGGLIIGVALLFVGTITAIMGDSRASVLVFSLAVILLHYNIKNLSHAINQKKKAEEMLPSYKSEAIRLSTQIVEIRQGMQRAETIQALMDAL